MAELTPMKKQYNEIKARHQDCLLFFRLGDFYEMFDDDAVLASRELDLALTTRDRSRPEDERTPMCGVPYHSAESYIARLIAKGYKVAICEQTEDPATAKGLVSRDVIRIITPGTVTESSMLQEDRSNYICAVYLDETGGGVSFADISTGEFCVSAFKADCLMHIANELGRFCPKETVLSPGAACEAVLGDFLSKRIDSVIAYRDDSFGYDDCAKRVLEQFSAENLYALGLEGEKCAVCAAGGLLAYLQETQKTRLSHISSLDNLSDNRYMELDYASIKNLELTENGRSGEKKGSLLWVLDKTKTSLGARMLRSWVERPLLNPTTINHRLTAVSELHRNTVLRGEIMQALSGIGDMRRLVSRAVYATANARDMKALAEHCAALPGLCSLLKDVSGGRLHSISLMDTLDDIAKTVGEAICDEPPFSVREGGMIRPGYNADVDYYRSVKTGGADMLRELEARERERTGIKKLKIGYNKVFGYYIDVPRSAGDTPLPDEYIRKQTLVSNERYITPELKELENTLLSAGDKLSQLEYSIFSTLRDYAAQQAERVQAAADSVAELDCYCSLAEVAARNNYCMPHVDAGLSIEIRDGRHPVVEKAVKSAAFVANDSYLNDSTDRCAIITGPNMAGKSTYMRQTALIVLMAQMGSFVPAKNAVIGVCDRVFTRIGASDDLATGRSTFMVEMSEMADILKYATPRSLLILDEIGRGTSTYDGMAIARAVLEHCADRRKLGAKTMFATHYHELSALEGSIPGVKNYNISAKKQGGELIFLRRIVPGSADRSYGIEVAKLAGVPDSVIAKAKNYLKELESGTGIPETAPLPADDQISLTDIGADEVRRSLESMDINSMTPMDALNALYELKKKVDMR